MWARGTGTFYLRIYDPTSGYQESSAFTVTSDWQRFSFTAAYGQTTSNLISVRMGSASNEIYFDGFQLEQKAYATPYADGSLGNGHSWSGTAHASTSSRTVATMTYPTAGNISASAGTISAWAYRDSIGGAWPEILAIQGTANYIILRLTTDGKPNAYWGASITATNPVTAGVWHHYASTYDGTTLKIYLDGVEVASGGTSGFTGMPANMGVGYSAWGGEQWNGQIDDFAIFPTALSAQEVYSIYKSNAPIQTEDKSSVLAASEIFPITSGGASKLILAGSVAGNVGVGTTNPLQKLHVEGQCVAIGTLIRRRRRKKNGEWEEDDVPVEDIEPGDEILSLNEDTGKFEWQMVEKTMDMGMQTSYQLTTESGKKIETTINHPYLVKIPDSDFAFVDEVGIFDAGAYSKMGIGALIIKKNEIELNQRLRNILLEAVSKLNQNEVTFEFKFKYITPNSLPFYHFLIKWKNMLTIGSFINP